MQRNVGRSLKKSRAFKSVVFIFALILINAGVRALPARLTRLDMSSSGLYTLSEDTVKLLSGLEAESVIYLICSDGNQDQAMDNLVRQFSGSCKKISYRRLDPDADALFISSLTDSSLPDNSWIVVSGERRFIVRYDDIYAADYENYFETGEYTTQFRGERCLVNALTYVSSDTLMRIYSLTGHGESQPGEFWQSAFASQGAELISLNLMSAESIPGDCACIFIFAPRADLSEAELAALEDYMDNGGRLLLAGDYVSGGLPGLYGLMEERYGLYASGGIVLEGDSSMCMSGYNFNLIPQLQRHDISAPLLNSGFSIVVPAAQGLTINEELPEKVYTKPLLLTSGTAYIKDPYTMTTLSRESGDETGQFSVAAAAKDMRFGARAVWIASSSVLDKEAVNWSNGGNEDFVINCLSWLCGSEDRISIHAKSVPAAVLNIPALDASILSVIFTAAVPALFLICGLCIYIRRTRR